MKRKLKFREWLEEERAKLSEMTLRQGLRYIWQYYSLYILGFTGAVWLIVYLIVHLTAGAPQYHLYAVFANSTAIAGNGSKIWKDFVERSGYDLSGEKVEFSTNMYFDYSRNRARGNEYYNRFIALTDSGTLDLITMMPDQLAPLGESGRLLDWNLERCAALRSEYADRLIWYEPPESAEETEPIPIGIDISDSLLVTRYQVYPETAALGIGAESTRLDAAADFLNFIFEK